MSTRNAFLRKKADRFINRARLFMVWERYSPVFALSVLFVCVFLIGSFSGLWQWIGDPWRLIVLGLALIWMIRTVLRARTLPFPTRSNAKRRVETDADVKHRPLDTLFDKPAITSEGWELHYRQAEDRIDIMSGPRLRPALAIIDKFFLRFIAPVGVILALMIGAGSNYDRLRHALQPNWIHGAWGDDITFEAWADPPAYTGRPPIYFRELDDIEIPEGSELVARINGTRSPSRLKIKGKTRTQYLKLTQIGPDSFEVRTILEDTSTASWRIGEIRKEWSIRTLKDQKPEINFVREPDADKRDRLIFAYSVEDDYGIETLNLKMTLLQDDPEATPQIKEVNVPLNGTIQSSDEESVALDLTRHVWAGKKVSAVLEGTDGKGQTATTEIVYFTVPDKIFVEPIAKAIMEHRSLILSGTQEYRPFPQLTRNQRRNRPWFDTFEPEFRLERAPADIQRAALLMDAVTDSPEGLFQDPAVYMGLRNVAYRLRYADEQADLSGLPEELWEIAIRAEFGVLGTALQEMREAEAALRDGIARRAPQREIDTLFDRYNEAVERYREELLRQAIEDQNVAEGGGGNNSNNFNVDQIQELLDAIEEANRQGDTEGARRALAQLAELLENMQIQLSQGGGGSGQGMPGELSEEMREALEDLADILGEQRELQDQTREAERQEQNQANSGGQSGSGETEQGQSEEPGLTPEELAELQGELLELLENADALLPENGEGSSGGGDEDGEGSGPDPERALEDARRAMAIAEEALRNGELGRAEEGQQAAIEALREAGRGLAELAREDNQGENGQQTANDGTGDPLGRDGNGNLDDSDADLDARDNARRSREIQKEIERRAAEQEREKQEREYLERLLRRF